MLRTKRLRRPRPFLVAASTGHERQLTDCLGELARVDRGIAHGLTESLLKVAAVHGNAGRAAALLEALPAELTCSREEDTGKVVVRERSWWRDEKERGGRLDWVFHPPGQERSGREFQLAVEVKDLLVPANAPKPWVQITLRGTDNGIILTSWVTPVARPRGPRHRTKRRHDQALRSLASSRLTPRYESKGDRFTRELPLRPGDSDVYQVVARALERELQHIVRSGVLDDDLAAA